MAGPGDDNITGGNDYTMHLGVEPDLGGVLQNLTVANDLLDQAQDKFKSITEVVGTTTQKMHELTRATQLFVTETQRARNEYQRLSTLTGPVVGGGGTGVPTSAPQVTPGTVQQAIDQNAFLMNQYAGGAGAGGGGGGGGLPPVGGFGGGPGGAGPNMGAMQMHARLQNLRQGGELLGRGMPFIKRNMLGINLGYAANQNNALASADYEALKSVSLEGRKETADALKLASPSTAQYDTYADMARAAFASKVPGEAAKFLETSRELGIKEAGSKYAGMAGEALGPIGKIGVPVIAGAYALSEANKMIAAPLISAVGYTGMTGGTSATGFGTSGPGAGFGQSAIGYGALQANLAGEYGIGPIKFDLNAALSKQTAGEITQTALQHGLSTGGSLNMGSIRGSQEKGAQAIEFMVTQAEKGLTDVNQTYGLYSSIVEESGGKVEDLNKVMTKFRDIAVKTDAGVQGLVQGMQQLDASFDQFGGTTGKVVEQLGSEMADIQAAMQTQTGREQAPVTATMLNQVRAAGTLGIPYTQFVSKVAMGEPIEGMGAAMLQTGGDFFAFLQGENPTGPGDLGHIIMAKGVYPMAIIQMAEAAGISQPGDSYKVVLDKIYTTYFGKGAEQGQAGAGILSGYALGGIITKPTVILAGEDGPEGITKLNDGMTRQLQKAQQTFTESYARDSARAAGQSTTSEKSYGRPSIQKESQGLSLPDDFYDKMGQQFLHAFDRGNMKQSTRDSARLRKSNWDV